MNKKKIIIIAVILILAVFFIARRKIELSHAPVVGDHPIMVHTVYVQKQDIRGRKKYLAEVQPFNQANISSRINAAVENVYVDEGSVVKKGNALADLEQRDIRAKLSSAEADLSSADENLFYWQSEYERDNDLFENGAISEEERDRAKNSLAQALARDKKAKENVTYMQTNLSYAKITAPFDGIVARRMVDPGDLATVGEKLFVVNDQRQMKLVFKIPQEDISLVKKGQIVSFQSGEKTVDVPISNIFPSLEVGKVVTVEATLPDNTGYLPGEFVSVAVTVSEEKDVTVIPKGSVILSEKNAPFVFLVENNKLKKFQVQIGLVTEDWVEVKNLSPGQAVVDGSYLSWSSLSDGQTVSIGGKP